MNNLTLHLKELEKSKVSRRTEVTKIRAEMNDQITVNISETKSWFLEKRNEADKTLATHQ